MRLLALLVLSALASLPACAQTSQSKDSQDWVASPDSLAQQGKHPANQTIVIIRRIGDPGIYLRAAGNTCGTIVSYNFSGGPNPHLKNVTTCTSLGTGTTRHAEGKKGKSPGPMLQYINIK